MTLKVSRSDLKGGVAELGGLIGDDGGWWEGLIYLVGGLSRWASS